MFNNIQQQLRKSFSKTANQYDILASLHREIGRELIERIVKSPGDDPVAILDVGCGTGYVSAKAKSYFPLSRVVGLDFAPGMLSAAQEKHEGIEWVLGDAQYLPFARHQFDMVVSNLAYQWVADLPKAFADVRGILKPNGIFACTLFGFFTCDELFESLSQASEGKIKFHRLPTIEYVKSAAEVFASSQVDYERIKIQFEDLWDLISWLRSIGANNIPREGVVSKSMLTKAAEIYRQRFPYNHGVCATFDVIWVNARA